jgi:hypothetical protein
MSRRPRRVLTPATVTARFPSFTSGRVENWAAASADGLWKYERIEISGTPWQVIHVPSGTDCGWYGNLGDARAATADGTALDALARLQAHDRGEHAAARDPGCFRC